ncbi:MAG: carbohydrate ABC transporter permease [Anaerolineae bacterium]|nr:carbohydrate ABC transporter permease [Anaerolineae bacterium]
MLSTSLKDPGSVFLFPPRWIPDPIVWGNYYEALTFLPFARYFANTAFITVANIVGTLVSASLAAYAFARLRAPLKALMFLLILSPMFLPGQVTMIPLFILYRHLNWIDTYNPLIVPAFFGGGAFNIFLLRQFFTTIPLELDHAARIDGCGEVSILWRIILPLSKPALATVTIFSFMGHWNDFLAPLIYINSSSKLTVSVALARFRGEYGTTAWHLLMAASIVAVLPCILIFFFAQEYFVKGIQMTGMKG